MDRRSGSEYLRDYLDFDLDIREGSARNYSVYVRSPAGEAQEEMRFPFDERQLRDKLKDLEIALLRSGGTRRRLSSEEQTVQDFGRNLFETVLVGKVGTCYYRSMDQAQQQGKGLRLKLHVQPPNLTVLPWEFLYDPDRDEYLCFSRDTPIVRYTDLRQPISRLAVAPPLRILGMVASPRDLDPLDVEHEKGLMDEAIEGLQAGGLVELTWLEGDTWRDLQRAMRRGGPWHIFHFVGHGDFDLSAEEGLIAFAEERTGRRHLLRSRDLARLLDGHRYLRLVFLNSCEGARGSEGDPFSGTAATLVRRGIPAVVAMQYQITDKAAIEFSSAFYESLADGLPVDAAVTEARVAVSMDSMLEWGTPVLYMRSPDGRLFDISTPAANAQQSPQTDDRQEEDPLPRYREAVESAWADGKLQANEVQGLRDLANNELRLSSDTAADIEREVMGDTIETILRRQEEAAKEEGRNRRLEELRTQARSLHRDRKWQAVIDVFEKIHAEDPAYPDREGLLASAREALEAQELGRRVAILYARGQRHIDVGEWQQALEVLEEVQRLESGYRDTEELLSRVRQELAPPSTVEVPDLSGQGIPQARGTLTNKSLQLGTRNDSLSDTVPEGQIIEQRPEAGTEVKVGSLVSVTVSSGPPTVEVPNLVGKTRSQAKNTLRATDLELGTLDNAPSEDVPEGNVVEQYPAAGTRAKHGDSVRIRVGSGARTGDVANATPSTENLQPSVTRPRSPLVLWVGLGALAVLAGIVVIAFVYLPVGTSPSEDERAQGGGGGFDSSGNANKTVTLGNLGWNENIAVSTLTQVVMEDQLGYGEVQVKGPLDIGLLFQGVAGGDLQAFQDVWLPNHESYLNEVENDVEVLDPWYEGQTAYGIAVPDYMDVQSIADVDQAGTDEITGIEPNARLHPVIKNKVIPGYNLDMKLVESSTAAMLWELDKKYKAKEPIVFLGWSPHWMNAKYDFHYLDDPKNLQGAFDDPSRITSIVNEDLADKDPVAYAFLKAISLDEEQVNTIEAEINDADSDDPEKGVRNWLKDNQGVVQPWIDAAKEAQNG